MDRVEKYIAKKIRETPAIYSYMEEDYRNRTLRRNFYLDLTAEIIREGIVAESMKPVLSTVSLALLLHFKIHIFCVYNYFQ